MTEKLVFWAQALDNASPDHIEFRGEELMPDDTVRREVAVSEVSKVVKTGSRLFAERGVQLTEDGHQFVIEVPSAERDRVGRTAPIVCYGAYDSSVDEAFAESVAAGVRDFARKIGRTIRPEHLDLALQSFSILKKKSSNRRLVRVIGIAALALAVLAVIYRLVLSES